ncbi:MAG: helicase [Coraliomargarita sp.]|nr:helicase [Coraliomargarita sp.]
MIGLIENTGTPREVGYLVSLVDSIFKEGGSLQTVLGLDHRPQQAAMALSVACSFESNQSLLVEAGTGVGKSLAYLIPGILHSVDSERPFIISSQTITLQEQIRNKDLKICQQLFKQVEGLQRYANFKTALMVGRGNYCCTTRLGNALKDTQSKQTEIFPTEQKQELLRLAKWSSACSSGVIQELTPPALPEVWDAVNADSSSCSRKNCDPSICFYQRARKQLLGANCVIVNHSLLFSLISAGMPPKGSSRGVLLADDFVVLDEAHRVPTIATDHFGIHVSSYSVDRALKRLYNPRTKRGIFKKNGSQWDLNAVNEAIVASREFFAYIGEVILCKKPILRIHEPNFCDNIISGPLKEVAERIAAIVQKIDDERMQDELKDHRSRMLSYQDTINGFIQIAENDHVHWIERGGKKGQIVTLRSAPLNVAPALREALFSRHTGVVLTSATLSDGQNMDSYQSKVGGDGAETQIESSPFNYNKNCRIYIATDSPLPEPGAGRLDLDYLSNMITWCSHHHSGGSLVLFTSHFDLRQVRERTEAFFKKIKRPLFCQGYESSRSELVRKFQNSNNGILFGTDSYWTGIDIPGPALSQVIIARLPFENPNHPVSEARNEYINSLGGHPFNDLIIPEALVRFRQGMGRLIRRHEDRGSIVILDSRIVSKPYGRQFIEALPTRDYKRFNRHNRESIFISPSAE